MSKIYKKLVKFFGVILYDLIAPVYDLFLRGFYRQFRLRAFEHLPEKIPAASVLDLACGTGQNFPFLASRVGLHGKIIGLDLSSGMLRSARRSLARCNNIEGFLLRHDADTISSDILYRQTKLRAVDLVVCTFAFSTMRDWKIAFHRSFDLLKPGGIYLILDVHAQKRTFRAYAVETFTRSTFSRETWHFLERLCPDFHMEYLDPSAHLFGGRVFVAVGTKP
jgi:ubiquinone/menaquinone biosynthesis C-methylase UbiE